MKKYIKSTKYELLGYVVDDLGYYAKVFLETVASSPEKALSNFRHQVHTDPRYAGWSLVTDPKLMNLLEYTGPRYNRWPKLSDNSKLVKL